MPCARKVRECPKITKRKKNFSNSEIETLLQQVNAIRGIIFSSVSSGFKATNKPEAWKEIMDSVNSVSGQRCSIEDEKKITGLT